MRTFTRLNTCVQYLSAGHEAYQQHPRNEGISIQLLGREDLTVDDAETVQEKWRQYIESYVLVSVSVFYELD
jgi:hypothetical protein